MRRGTMQVQILPRVQKNISDRISANLCSNAVAFECGAARSHHWHNVRQIRRLGLRISLPSSSAILRTQLLHARYYGVRACRAAFERDLILAYAIKTDILHSRLHVFRI
jgi:hypothetical protein